MHQEGAGHKLPDECAQNTEEPTPNDAAGYRSRNRRWKRDMVRHWDLNAELKENQAESCQTKRQQNAGSAEADGEMTGHQADAEADDGQLSGLALEGQPAGGFRG